MNYDTTYPFKIESVNPLKLASSLNFFIFNL